MSNSDADRAYPADRSKRTSSPRPTSRTAAAYAPSADALVKEVRGLPETRDSLPRRPASPRLHRGLQQEEAAFRVDPRPHPERQGDVFPGVAGGKTVPDGDGESLSGIVEEAPDLLDPTRRAPAPSFRTTIPAIFESRPDCTHCVSIRSSRYAGSPTSSRKSNAPRKSGSYGVPRSAVITERHPPASTPSAAPLRIRSVGSPHGSRGETSPAARRAKASSAPAVEPQGEIGRRHRPVETRKAEARGEVREDRGQVAETRRSASAAGPPSSSR